jgi:beta-glucosidase
MCAYNRVNGDYACGNDWLLNRVLKGDWDYPGWVLSDWGAVHGVDYAVKGLDQQSGEQIDAEVFFDEPLFVAITDGSVPEERISDMVRRILRSMFAVGLFDEPASTGDIDYEPHWAEAQTVAEQSLVVLRNEQRTLPLSRALERIAVIGGYADLGVMSGGGSSQVTAAGGPSDVVPMGGDGPLVAWRKITLHPSPPLRAIRGLLPNAEVVFDDGRYPRAAARAAASADVAIVFATQWMLEHYDAPDISLPSGQDDLIRAVAAANPRTVVVLETGGPVLMPWLEDTAAVVAAWYSGQRGGDAIANVLFGVVQPAGRLPITFPASDDQLVRPELPGASVRANVPFEVDYHEGSDVGYRYFARHSLEPAFAFGYGQSFTTFEYGGLEVSGQSDVRVAFEVTNTGSRAGWAVPQVYLTSALGVAERRLLGWDKALLAPGESKRFSLDVDPRLLAEYSTDAARWELARGTYEIALATSAADIVSRVRHDLGTRSLPP